VARPKAKRIVSRSDEPLDPRALSELAGIPAGTRPKVLWPAPTTAIVGVVGFPVRHSLSPRLQNAAFAVMGLDWCYLAFEVPPSSLQRAVAGAASLGLRGLSVTMPHKDAAARLATRHSRQVRRLGAANTLIFEGAAITAESCDGDALLDDLREGAGFDPAGRRCGVIGAGGAGRAAVLALAEAGAAEIVVVNRTAARAWRSVALAPTIAHVGRPEELRGMDLVVQATPAGMPAAARSGVELAGVPSRGAPERPSLPSQSAGPRGPDRTGLTAGSLGGGNPRGLSPSVGSRGSGSSPVRHLGGSSGPLVQSAATEPTRARSAVQEAGSEEDSTRVGWSSRDAGREALVAGVDPGWFGTGQLVVDLVYDPPRTSFLLEAERHGATVRSGLGMLVHQAARQIRLWTGAEPPLEVMWAVVRQPGSQTQPRESAPLSEPD
jgi:shikimate dehydrogenase